MSRGRRPRVAAIVLFGSRARGDHRANSDWDLCLVGGQSATAASEALTERFDNKDWPLNTIWTATGQELRAATEGTVWAHIVREGRVLAGHPHLFDDITIKPMTPHTVRLQLGLTVRRLRRAATATVARAHEPEWERDRDA